MKEYSVKELQAIHKITEVLKSMNVIVLNVYVEMKVGE